MSDEGPETEVTAEQAETSSAVKEVPAGSAPAGEQGSGGVLDAVKAALAPQKESSPDSETEGSKDEPKPDESKPPEEAGDEDEGSDDDLTEEELSRLNKKARVRIGKLLAHRDELYRENGELKPLAEQHQKLVRYVSEAGLSPEEVNTGFEVMRDLKNDPLKAFERLKPIFSQLQQMVGEVLPEDLQSEVARGAISEAHARDLARNRSVAAVSQQTLVRTRQQAQEREQAAQVQAHVDAVASSVTEWEKSKAKSDPDWKLKQARVTELVQLELYKRQAEGKPFPTKDEAIGMSEAALKRVAEDFKRLAPKPREIKPSVETASTRSTAKPKSALEAARIGLAQMSAG